MRELDPRWQRAHETWRDAERWGQEWDPDGRRRPRPPGHIGLAFTAMLGLAALVLVLLRLG